MKCEDLPSNLRELFNSKNHFTEESVKELNYFDMTSNIEYEFAYLEISDMLFQLAWINQDTHKIEWLSKVFDKRKTTLLKAMNSVIDNWLEYQTGKYDYLAEIQIMDENNLKEI